MTSKEPSPAPSSGGDTIDDQPDDVKPSVADLDHDNSAADILAATGTPSSVKSNKRGKTSSAKRPRPKKGALSWINESRGDGTEDEIKRLESPDIDSKALATATGTRRQANGTVGSVYSGSKVRHIKKQDGAPIWRKEIQYEFLRLVVEDTKPVFTRMSDGKKNCTFVDIYVDCMARSSKISKVLKDRLQKDKQAAQNMAMICLLVNVGRINTTLNFFPEMRAQLRTYHPIPALQAYKSQKDYKSLQDAPRLKSILKGASEDTEEPRSIAAIKAAPVPRTNPVNLIFVLSQSASEIAQDHFKDKVDFFDLAIRHTISSRSRATAFLWLMWWYLESSFDRQSAMDNPYGAGQFADTQDSSDPNQIPQLVPPLVTITEEEGDAENVDPEEEKAFAQRMTKERQRLTMQEMHGVEGGEAGVEHRGVKRLRKSAKDFDDDSDMDSPRASPGFTGRSPAPGTESMLGVLPPGVTARGDSLDDDWEAVDPHPGRGRYKRVKGKNTPSRSKQRASDIAPRGRARVSGLAHDRWTPDTVGAQGIPQPVTLGGAAQSISSQYNRSAIDASQPSKSRARTGYQRQLEEHRNSRIEWLLKKKRREMLKDAGSSRQTTSFIHRLASRIQDLDTTYDSEEDGEAIWHSTAVNSNHHNGISQALSGQSSAYATGIGGLIACRVQMPSARPHDDLPSRNRAQPHSSGTDDFGEEAEAYLKLFRRAKRRLLTWSGERDHDIYLSLSASQPKSRRPLMPVLEAKKAEKAAAMIAARNTRAPVPSEASLKAIKAPARNPRKSAGGRRVGGTPLRSAPGIDADGAEGKIGRATGSGRAAGSRKRGRELEEEITEDLLAERSEDDGSDGPEAADDDDIDMGDGDDGEGDVDADGDGDGEADLDGDADDAEAGDADGDPSDMEVD